VAKIWQEIATVGCIIFISLVSTDKYMPLIERKSIINNKNEVEIKCDLCNLFMYNNNIEFEKQNIHASERGLYICSICVRNIAISDLKALSLDD
jgi:Pyruvate/2-oxoacid:ferredoxin oxidoreductase delta subunit